MRSWNKKSISIILVICMAVGLTFYLLSGHAFAQSPGPATTLSFPAGRLEIHYLCIGQADSTFIKLPNGQTMLIDAGLPLNSNHVTGGERIVQYIRSLGVNTIDYLIVTHPHYDHIAAIPSVIDAFEIQNIFMPDITHTTQAFVRVLDAIERNGLTIQTVQAGDELFNFAGLRANFAAPNSQRYRNLNNYSIVTRLEYGGKYFLFMGDAEAIVENEILEAGHGIAADVIMAGHHGSNTSSTLPFLQAVSPQIAVISVGSGNSYGHPHTEVLDRLAALGVDVYRTDLDGTIVIIYHNGNLSVQRTGRSVL